MLLSPASPGDSILGYHVKAVKSTLASSPLNRQKTPLGLQQFSRVSGFLQLRSQESSQHRWGCRTVPCEASRCPCFVPSLSLGQPLISACPCTLPFQARCVDGVSWCPLLEADFVHKCNGPETYADSSCAHRLSFLSPCLVASEFVLTLCPFGLIPAFATVNKAARNVCIQVFVWT